VTDLTKIAPPVATIDLMGDSKYQEILPEVSVSLPQEVKKVEIDLMPEIP